MLLELHSDEGRVASSLPAKFSVVSIVGNGEEKGKEATATGKREENVILETGCIGHVISDCCD